MRVIRVAATIACSLLALFVSLATASAEKRVALVIGNGEYNGASRLPNPRNDAEDVAAALKRIGFDTIVGLDLNQITMRDHVIQFARAVRGADVALFYYAGHAMQFGGVNYLLPVDVSLSDEADLRRMTRVDEVIDDLKQAKNLRMLVLDSCRDNPLAEDFKRSIGATRAVSAARGLARIENTQGLIVAFATLSGRTAADGKGRNSPYTTAFLRNIETQEEIVTVFRRVADDVTAETNKSQIPEISLSISGEFYLNGKLEVRAGTPPATTATNTTPQLSEAAEAWATTRETASQAVLEIFIQKFGNTVYGAMARARLEELKKSQIAVVAPPVSPVPPPQPVWNYGPPAPAETAKSRVNSFTWTTTPQEVSPGVRVWKRESDDTWSETYPSGFVARPILIRARTVLDGCAGSVVGSPDEPGFAVFLPDKGCAGMTARWQRGQGTHWNVLGAMQNVR